MEIDDEYIKELHKNRQQIRRSYSDEVLEYLNNRYSDSLSLNETVWRILYDIEERPKCKICGNDVVFVGRKHNIFAKTCSEECTSRLKSKNASKVMLNLSDNDK